MNQRGHPQSLIAAHPGNLNAVKQGVHSPRLIQARATEIAAELTQTFAFSPAEQLAAHEAARCIAILEAIDRDLDQRGLVDRKGEPRYLLNHRTRISRQLEHWLESVSAAIERQASSEQSPSRGDFPTTCARCSTSPSDRTLPRPRATASPRLRNCLNSGTAARRAISSVLPSLG